MQPMISLFKLFKNQIKKSDQKQDFRKSQEIIGKDKDLAVKSSLSDRL